MFGDRLKLARKKAGYSLRGLSEALGGSPSAQAIGKYERGEMMARSDVLLRIARTLSVSLEYLLSDRVEKLEAIEFRKHSGTTARNRARVEAAVIDELQRDFAIEEVLDLKDRAWSVPPVGNRKLEREEDGEALAQRLRRSWALGTDPVPDMTSLLEDRGLKILVMPLPDGVFGLTCLVRRPGREAKVPVIVVNSRNTLERRRFTLAHELAHRLIDETSRVDHEKASHVFAGAFLAPRDHLLREIGNHRAALGYQELIQLKRIYRISGATLLLRLAQINVISRSTLTHAFRTFARGWRKNEPNPLEDPEQESKHEMPQRFERLCYRALAEQWIDKRKAGELLQRSPADIERGLRGPAESDEKHRR